MAGDPLYQPLGTGGSDPDRLRRSYGTLLAATALTASIGVAAVLWFHAQRQPSGSDAVASIEAAPKPSEPAPTPPPAAPVVVAAPPPSSPPGSTVEVQNGVKIIRFSPAASPESVMIPVDSPVSPLAPAPDPRVSEKTADGVLPRIGPDGARPSAIYARPAIPAPGPQVALLLTGMGVDQMATADAARRLSPDLSFGFGSDVADASAQVAETRHAGHEVFLDLSASMAGDAHPSIGEGGGPDLRRAMGRFSGYVGVLTPAGASGIAGEVSGRGLLALAGGTAAPGRSGPRITADDWVDARAGEGAVATALRHLIDLAKANGASVGVIDHAGAAAEVLAASPAKLAAEGLTLVPVSQVLGRLSGPEPKAPK